MKFDSPHGPQGLSRMETRDCGTLSSKGLSTTPVATRGTPRRLEVARPGPGWLRYDFGAGKARTINRYTMTSADDVPGRDPKDWQFQGSNDGSTWATLDTRSDQSFACRFQTVPYGIATPGAYRYYRLNVTANHGAEVTQLSELGFFHRPEPHHSERRTVTSSLAESAAGMSVDEGSGAAGRCASRRAPRIASCY